MVSTSKTLFDFNDPGPHIILSRYEKVASNMNIAIYIYIVFFNNDTGIKLGLVGLVGPLPELSDEW